MKKFSKYILSTIVFCLFLTGIFASPDSHDSDNHGNTHEEHHSNVEEKEHAFDAKSVILHHIGDANEFHIVGNLSMPLPVILWDKQEGLKFFMSSAFKHGHKAVDGFVLDHGVVKKVVGDFPKETVEVEVHHGEVVYDGHHFETEGKTTLLKATSFYDFSITKIVFAMMLSILILIIIFIGMARFYKKGNKVPKGIYSALEPLILFVKDDIAIPNIGKGKYAKFLPYLLTVFFFVWLNNLLGLIPFFPGSANVTGNIALTLVLSVATMILTNINGSKTYWGHIFNPPVPLALKPIMIPIELIGVLTKPFALMVRLFANISAGHVLILSLLSLIFIFKSYMVAPVSVIFVFIMSMLELLVAFLQAYIFTLLSALFIGLAVDDHH